MQSDRHLNWICSTSLVVIESGRMLISTTANTIIESMEHSRTVGANTQRHLDGQTCRFTSCVEGAAVKQSIIHVMPGKEPNDSTILPVNAAPRPLNTNNSAAIEDSVSAFDKGLPNKMKSNNTSLLRVIATMVPRANLLGRVASRAGQGSPQHLQTTGRLAMLHAALVSLTGSDVVSFGNTIQFTTLVGMGRSTKDGIRIIAKLNESAIVDG